jgi:hypothetical protein
MDTAILENRFSVCGRATVSAVFGEYARGVVTLVLEGGRVLHLHDSTLIEQLATRFGSPTAVAGLQVFYRVDQCGIVTRLNVI